MPTEYIPQSAQDLAAPSWDRSTHCALLRGVTREARQTALGW